MKLKSKSSKFRGWWSYGHSLYGSGDKMPLGYVRAKDIDEAKKWFEELIDKRLMFLIVEEVSDL